MKRVRAMAALLILAVASGCGDSGDSGATLRVFSAASLGDLVDELATAFDNDAATTGDWPDGITIDVHVAGSSTLRLQLDEGATADVFAPADLEQLALLDVATVGDPIVFASNRLVVAHRADAPPISIEQFADTDLLLGACAPSVPCGAYAAIAFDVAGIDPALDTEEPDVRSLAAKVAEGELDAGLVYATDVLADRRLAAVELPSSVDVSYPVVQLADAPAPELAQAFIEFLHSDTAEKIIADHGFGLP